MRSSSSVVIIFKMNNWFTAAMRQVAQSLAWHLLCQWLKNVEVRYIY